MTPFDLFDKIQGHSGAGLCSPGGEYHINPVDFTILVNHLNARVEGGRYSDERYFYIFTPHGTCFVIADPFIIQGFGYKE